MIIDENCSHTTQSLSAQQIRGYLRQTPNWQYKEQAKALSRSYQFKRYTDGLDFAVKVGLMADAQNHHPNMHVFYKKCIVEFTTHSAKGVSVNDFICAAKSDEIFNQIITSDAQPIR